VFFYEGPDLGSQNSLLKPKLLSETDLPEEEEEKREVPEVRRKEVPGAHENDPGKCALDISQRVQFEKFFHNGQLLIERPPEFSFFEKEQRP
jgi:hypothetical protein